MYRLSAWWFAFLFERPWTWRKVWCRMNEHPPGPVFYNSDGLEPDWRCAGCGDLLR